MSSRLWPRHSIRGQPVETALAACPGWIQPPRMLGIFTSLLVSWLAFPPLEAVAQPAPAAPERSAQATGPMILMPAGYAAEGNHGSEGSSHPFGSARDAGPPEASSPASPPAPAAVAELYGRAEELEQKAHQLAQDQPPRTNPNRELLERLQLRMKLLRSFLEKKAGPVKEPITAGQEGAASPRVEAKGTSPTPAAEEARRATQASPALDQDAPSSTPTGGQRVPPLPAKDAQPSALPKVPSAEQSPEAAGPDRPGPLRSEPQGSSTSAGAVSAGSVTSVSVLAQPVDPLAAARAFLRCRQYVEALRLYESLRLGEFPDSERSWVLYEKAACFKAVGQIDRALPLYREVAANATDPDLREAARWQVESLKATQELRAALQELSRVRQYGDNVGAERGVP
jgi:tetratricopeptide (TPR) repeat protein